MDRDNNSKYIIKSIQKALDIIECFSIEKSELTLTDFQHMLDLDKTNIYRIIINLEERGLIQRNPVNGKFRLGNIMLHYAQVCMANLDIHSLSLPYMQRLSEETGETVIINAVQNNMGICIARVNSVNPVKITADLGNRVPLLRGSSGKILAAFLSEDRLRSVYEEEKNNLTVSYEEIAEEMGQIRKRGYAVSLEELDPQTAGVSCPIFNIENKMVGGLSTIGPLYRFTEENIAHFTKATLSCAMDISHAMGYGR